ncbi:uncharacterized protein LOC106879217 [Octopus bimaculoides]|uniref:Death domain-containing protein n=1 Tax=Octopus bimaculoides TaxID=37653 RepID=A0A0L8G5M8_OCTBM|nr:uncharacterized protein LOC106879217 [Octopus bimaculoides]|eukprot:XP_014784180.1 PREDICTED: uncharacterized protein LOC106879217 [Octopus bimaculoides]
MLSVAYGYALFHRCLLCEVNDATVMFHPCEHTVTCNDCCLKIERKTCPECRQVIAEKSGFESIKLEVKHLNRVSMMLGNQWQQVGIELGLKQIELDIIKADHPCDTIGQSFQMLKKWFKKCKTNERTFKTLRDAFELFHCYDALKCLDSVNV